MLIEEPIHLFLGNAERAVRPAQMREAEPEELIELVQANLKQFAELFGRPNPANTISTLCVQELQDSSRL
jgi:hypothetical protein